VTCYNRTASEDYNGTVLECQEVRRIILQEYIEMGVDAIAMKPCQEFAYEEIGEVFQEAEDAGIPVVTFDSDIENVTRVANVGTNNTFLGRTLAGLLRQLRPEGGTFALVGLKEPRTVGFRESITKYNGRKGWAQWHPVPGEWLEKPPDGDYINLMEQYAQLNPTAMVCIVQSPMRDPRWPEFVKKYRHKNITFIGTDGDDYQIEYLNRGLVDGLVGQVSF